MCSKAPHWLECAFITESVKAHQDIMALTNFILPVGREVRLQYAFAERLICEVALIGAFYTHIANLFLRSAIERSSMLACLRPLHPALSQITRLLSIV